MNPLEPETNWTTVASKIAAVLMLAATIMLALNYCARAQTTFRDASGRLTGTSSRDSNGQTTYRDGAGRQTGTSSTNSNGTTTFRDGSGRITGTAERRR
jgi:YD repeat-containing protein